MQNATETQSTDASCTSYLRLIRAQILRVAPMYITRDILYEWISFAFFVWILFLELVFYRALRKVVPCRPAFAVNS